MELGVALDDVELGVAVDDVDVGVALDDVEVDALDDEALEPVDEDGPSTAESRAALESTPVSRGSVASSVTVASTSRPESGAVETRSGRRPSCALASARLAARASRCVVASDVGASPLRPVRLEPGS